MKHKLITNKDKEIIISDQEEVFFLDYFNDNKTRENIDIKIGNNCLVKLVFILGNSRKDSYKIARNIFIGDNSQVESYQVYFGKNNIDGRFSSYLGEHSSLKSQAFFYQTDHQNLQIQDNFIFQAPSSTGRFLITGLLDEQAKASYFSDIVIEPKAQETDSRIDMKLYLLSNSSVGRLLPGLKIAANRVKAGHGASTFNLSPDDLFYLQSRGLTPAHIRSLIINSLGRNLMAAINDGKANKIIDNLLRKTFKLKKYD